MASEKVQKLLDDVKELSVLELNELVKACEEEFGVSANSVAVAGVAPAAGGEVAAAEKTEFDVVLSDVGTNKIKVIKAVREITGLGLKEAKELVDSVPKSIKTGVSKDDAESMKSTLEAEGAKVDLK